MPAEHDAEVVLNVSPVPAVHEGATRGRATRGRAVCRRCGMLISVSPKFCQDADIEFTGVEFTPTQLRTVVSSARKAGSRGGHNGACGSLIGALAPDEMPCGCALPSDGGRCACGALASEGGRSYLARRPVATRVMDEEVSLTVRVPRAGDSGERAPLFLQVEGVGAVRAHLPADAVAGALVELRVTRGGASAALPAAPPPPGGAAEALRAPLPLPPPVPSPAGAVDAAPDAVAVDDVAVAPPNVPVVAPRVAPLAAPPPPPAPAPDVTAVTVPEAAASAAAQQESASEVIPPPPLAVASVAVSTTSPSAAATHVSNMACSVSSSSGDAGACNSTVPVPRSEAELRSDLICREGRITQSTACDAGAIGAAHAFSQENQTGPSSSVCEQNRAAAAPSAIGDAWVVEEEHERCCEASTTTEASGDCAPPVLLAAEQFIPSACASLTRQKPTPARELPVGVASYTTKVVCARCRDRVEQDSVRPDKGTNGWRCIAEDECNERFLPGGPRQRRQRAVDSDDEDEKPYARRYGEPVAKPRALEFLYEGDAEPERPGATAGVSRQPARCDAPERYDFPVFLDPARLKAPADTAAAAPAVPVAEARPRAASSGYSLRDASLVRRAAWDDDHEELSSSRAPAVAAPPSYDQLLPTALLSAGSVVRCVSDFSGIGGTEFGLKAGFEQLGVGFELVQASEALSTKKGQHNAGVLRQRFPGVRVLSEEERMHVPFPEEARLAVVTPICSEHSPLKQGRDPAKTEALLEPLFARLAAAPWIVAIFFENVPEFLCALAGQTRSSYSYWVANLERVGFRAHAYAILSSSASGDLHERPRLISVHSREGGFSPALVFASMLDTSGDDRAAAESSQQPVPPAAAASAADADGAPFAFRIGKSANRASSNSTVHARYHALPAYNSSLSVAVFFEGKFWSVGPWLAGRASALPAEYQGDSKALSHRCSALANMVSPLQSRDVGVAVAKQWSWCAPTLPDALVNADVCELQRDPSSGLPVSYPRRAPGGAAVFVSKLGPKARWRQAKGQRFRRISPPTTLGELCTEARKRGDLKVLGPGRHFELRRVADDVSLSSYARACARRQLVDAGALSAPRRSECTPEQWRIFNEQQTKLYDVSRAELAAHIANFKVKMPKPAPPPLALPQSAALMPPMQAMESRKRRANRIDERPLKICRLKSFEGGVPMHKPVVLHSDRSRVSFVPPPPPEEGDDDDGMHVLSAAAETAIVPVAASSTERTWVQCSRCAKWRALGVAAEKGLPDEWFCEMNADAAYASCGAAEEAWVGEEVCGPGVDALVTKVYKHRIFSGATVGALYRCYVSVGFSDGGVTRGTSVPAELVAGTAALATYVATEHGEALARYMPPIDSGRYIKLPLALSKPTEMWVQCGTCGKWRLVGLRAPNQRSKHFTCGDNPNSRYGWCEVPQQLPDDEIHRRLGLSPPPAPLALSASNASQ